MHYVRAVLEGARRRGVDVAPLLADAGITPSAESVSQRAYLKLTAALMTSLDDEFLGLCGRPSRPGTFAMMCRLLVHCPDLGAALHRAADFYALFDGTPRARLTRTGSLVRITVTGVEPFAARCALLVVHRLASWAIGRWIPSATAAEFYGCVSGDGELVFDAALLSAPIVRTEADLDRLLRDAFGVLLTVPVPRASLGERVRSILSGSMAGGPPSTVEIAARLHVSPQTLRRRLREEGVCYRELRDDVLREVATDALERGGLSVGQIAERLGFSDASAFHRAFKRWSGTTPGAWRDHALGA